MVIYCQGKMRMGSEISEGAYGNTRIKNHLRNTWRRGKTYSLLCMGLEEAYDRVNRKSVLSVFHLWRV